MSAFKVIVEYLSENLTLEESDITKSATFHELGVDSITYLELLEYIREKYGIDLMKEHLSDFDNIGKLAKYIEEHK